MTKEELRPYIDHTLLRPAHSNEIVQLCNEAKKYGFASVCVQPFYVKLAARELAGTPVKVCTVVGFPLGDSTTKTKVYETKNAIRNGATEIDMVMNQSLAVSNSWKRITKDIAAVKAACGDITLKVIVETCNLTPRQLIKACHACAEGGAQFIKTSTGYGRSGASIDDVSIMADVGHPLGLKVKASGGIHTYEEACALVESGADRLGTSSAIKICGD